MGWMPQTCIVHLIRHSMDFALWKDRKSGADAADSLSRTRDLQHVLDALLDELGGLPSVPVGLPHP